jgi:hypothetical protein
LASGSRNAFSNLAHRDGSNTGDSKRFLHFSSLPVSSFLGIFARDLVAPQGFAE